MNSKAEKGWKLLKSMKEEKLNRANEGTFQKVSKEINKFSQQTHSTNDILTK